MRQKVLCVVAGASLSSFFIHVGMLATPFFGAGAFLWANVLAALMLASVLGELLAFARWRTGERAGAPLAVLGGVLGWLALYLAPLACRAVLDRDPEWTYAPSVAVALVAVLPGAVLAAVAPTALASLSAKDDAPFDQENTAVRLRRQAHGAGDALALRGLGLLGALLGVGLAAQALFRPESANVWLSGYAGAALTAVAGLVYLRRPGRLAGGAALAALAVVSGVRPSEVQTTGFAVALERAWRAGRVAGSYYRSTADDEPLLADADLTARAQALRGSERETPGVILACEMLLSLGNVTVKGDGLRRSIDLLLAPEAKKFLLPFFDQFEEVSSDGKGMLHVTLRRQRGEEGRRFVIPGEKPGETVKFWLKDDFTVHLARERSVWRLAFGPLVTRRAGIFDLNDTNETPVRVLDAAWFIDASILGLVFEEYNDRLVIKALAQGQIGDVKTVEVGSYKKQPKR